MSIIIELYLFLVIAVQLQSLVLNENPYISTVAKSHDDADKKIYLNETSLITFAFYDYSMSPKKIDKSKLHLWVERHTETGKNDGDEHIIDRFEVK